MSQADDAAEVVEPAESPNVADDPMGEFFRPPRLGIIHLLAWTTATAVFLKLNLANDSLGGAEYGPNTNPIHLATLALDAVIEGAALAGLCTLLFARRRSRVGSLQPGHWILLALGLADLLGVLGDLLVNFFAGSLRSWYFDLFVILCLSLHAVLAAASGGGCWFAASKSRPGVGWRASLRALTVAEGIAAAVSVAAAVGFGRYGYSFVVDYAWHAQTACSLTILVALSIRAIVDWFRYRRDWLHWLGIVTVCGGLATETLQWVLTFFFGVG